MNRNPIDDSVIIVVWASHRIDSVRRRRKTYPPTTLIEITPEQYADFKCNSIIDCNKYREKSIDELVGKLLTGKLKLKTEMSLSLVNQLRQGLLDSPNTPARIRKILR